MSKTWNALLDRARSPQAARVAREKGKTESFDQFRGAKYTLLVTHKRSGEPVPTPVWAGLGADGKLYIRTEADVAKVKRIRNDPHVKVARCGSRGQPRGDLIEARARVLPADEEERAEQALKAHFGLGRRIYESTMGAAAGPAVYIEVSPVGQEEAA